MLASLFVEGFRDMHSERWYSSLIPRYLAAEICEVFHKPRTEQHRHQLVRRRLAIALGIPIMIWLIYLYICIRFNGSIAYSPPRFYFVPCHTICTVICEDLHLRLRHRYRHTKRKFKHIRVVAHIVDRCLLLEEFQLSNSHLTPCCCPMGSCHASCGSHIPHPRYTIRTLTEMEE